MPKLSFYFFGCNVDPSLPVHATGEHTVEIARNLGLDGDAIAAMLADGVLYSTML